MSESSPTRGSGAYTAAERIALFGPPEECEEWGHSWTRLGTDRGVCLRCLKRWRELPGNTTLTRLHWQLTILSAEEIEEVERIGKLRYTEAIRLGMRTKHFYKSEADGIKMHTVGAWGEAAAAKHLNIVWPKRVNVGTKMPDLDPDIEVRTSTYMQKLKIRASDHTRVIAVFKPRKAHAQIVGWVYAREARKLGDMEDPGMKGRPNLFIPYSRLRSMQTWGTNV
jgi:hypothetical protein